MKFLRLLCLLPALVILLATCKEAGAPTDTNGNPTGNVTTTLAGIVTDESGQPLFGVAVIANGKNAVTDKYGTFMIQNANVPGNRCVILCKKNGYFTGSRAEIPKGGGITELRLTLQSSAPGYTVNSSTGGTVSIGTAFVKFPPSAFVTSDGSPFTGTVKVAAKHLDPSQNSFYNSFSGDMTARRTDGTQTELLSYGVIRVRLTDDVGNELKLAAGKTATLTYPIAQSQQLNAPASMPLWYFDEALGMWKEEGVAVKSGDVYMGEVSHFTDWNCDLPAKTVTIKGRVMCNNEGVSGIVVTVGQRKVVTDNEGYFSQRVPMKVDFTISIQPIENFNLTAADVAVPSLNEGEERVVNIQLTTCPAYISGIIADCKDSPVAGIVDVSYPGGNCFHFTKSGEFKMRVPSGVELSVEAIAFDGKITLLQSIGTLNSGENRDIGRISACENGMLSEFYEIKLGIGYTYSTVLSPDGSLIAINGNNKSLGTKFTGVYDVKTGAKMFELTKDGAPQAINFSADSKMLLICWRTDSALVVNPLTGAVLQRFNGIRGNNNDVRILPDGSGIVDLKFFRYGSEGPSSTDLQLFSMVDGSKVKDLSPPGGMWEFIGIRADNQLIFLDTYGRSDIHVVHWDITTDSKMDVIFPKTDVYNDGTFSPDYSVIALSDKYNTDLLNFYNTQTGVKINTSLITLQAGGSTPEKGTLAVANDLTCAVQSTGNNGQLPAPFTFSILNGKIVNVLATQSQSAVYSNFEYSANSKYLSAIQQVSTVDPSMIAVRIWKVK